MKINRTNLLKYVGLIILGIVITTSIIILLYGLYDFIRYGRYQRPGTSCIKQPIRLFQIGFSKCGTVTLAHFFNENGVPTVHHDFGSLAISMHDNAMRGLELIAPQYQEYLVFTDMEDMTANPPINIAVQYFKVLDQQYPGSKFILNTRDKAAWLRSRSAHPIFGKNVTNLLSATAAMLQISEAQVLEMWSQEWDTHHAAVLEYFKDRPQDLLVFNIDSDSPQKLQEFLKDYYKLNLKYYGHFNKTPKQVMTKVEDPVIPVKFFIKTYQYA